MSPDARNFGDGLVPVERNKWWITTGPLSKGGTLVLGPFESRDLALDVRVYVEKVRKTDQLWVCNEDDGMRRRGEWAVGPWIETQA